MKSSYQIPQRITYKSIYTFELPNININTQASEYPSIDSFFLYNKSWTSSNIIQTLNKDIIIFLSKNAINVHLKSPNDYTASYIASLILGFNALLPLQSEYLTFGKIKGIYWSRLCQNIKDLVRKPIIKPINNDNIDNIDKNHTVILDGVAYECSKEINNDREFIGFLNKPYQLSGACLPCCFMNSQVDKKIYNKCTNSEIVSSLITPLYSLFIIDAGRLLSNNRLGFLNETIDLFLNKNNMINISAKLLIEAKTYFLVSGNNPIYLESEIKEDAIIEYLDKHHQHIIIDENTFYTSPYLVFDENVVYLQLLKDLLFHVVCVTKLKSNDTLKIEIDYRVNALILNNELLLPHESNFIINNFIQIPTAIPNLEVLTKSNESNSVHICYNFNQI